MLTFYQYVVEQSREIVALLPGGFKPPTKGHFNAFKHIMDNATRGAIFIGKGERDGINAEQSARIWEIYSKYLGKPVSIAISKITPVKDVYDYADANSGVNIIVGAGAKDEDIKRYDYFLKNKEKYPFVQIYKIPIQSEGISGTKTRALISSNIDEAIDYFAPAELSVEDKNAIRQILTVQSE
jgi:hypothetical protein